MTDQSSLLLVENCALVATMDDSRNELSSCDILIESNLIKQVGSNLREELDLSEDIPYIDARGCLAVPGFVNVHHHFWQVLTRCLPRVQNAELFHWLVEQYHVFEACDPQCFYTSARVALSELLLSGCTTTSDHHYLFPKGQPVELIDEDIRAAKELGIRFTATRGSMTLGEDNGGLPPETVIEKDDRVLEDYDRLISRYHDRSHGAMTQIALAPCAPFNVTPRLFQETVGIARRHGVRLHTHLAETDDEDKYVQEKFQKRPFRYVADQGWSGSDVWFAHCVKLNQHEIEEFAASGIGVAHCPSANCRLGSGVAPVPAMLKAGVPVGFGVDGSASNDSGHLLGEAQLAFLLHRATWGVDSITARDCLWMLTRGGAEVLGRSDIGQISAGMCADIVLFDQRRLQYAGGPSLDPVAGLIMCGKGQAPSWTIINGRIVVQDSRIVGLDERGLVEEANQLTEKIVSHAEKKRGIDYRKIQKW